MGQWVTQQYLCDFSNRHFFVLLNSLIGVAIAIPMGWLWCTPKLITVVPSIKIEWINWMKQFYYNVFVSFSFLFSFLFNIFSMSFPSLTLCNSNVAARTSGLKRGHLCGQTTCACRGQWKAVLGIWMTEATACVERTSKSKMYIHRKYK